MDIIITGDGEVGLHLAKLLTNENHNITIISSNDELIKEIENNTDLLSITGNPTSIETLRNAKTYKTDLFISVNHEENINIISCILAKKLGAKRTIARITNTEYLTPQNKELFKTMGVDAMVCPERIAANEIIRLLNQATATEIFDFSGGKLLLFLIKLDDNAPVIGKTLNIIAAENPQLSFRAVAIHRNSNTIIPRGNDAFETGDLAYVITKPEAIDQLLKLGGKEKLIIKDIIIVGGSKIGIKAAIELEKNYNVKLIENNKQKCTQIAEILSDTLIIHGDARDIELLEQEGITETDAFIAVTEDSETNILTSLLAKKLGVKKIIPLIENIDYLDIAQNIGLETFINKKLITASYIFRFTMRAEVSSIKCLNGADAEVLEFVVKKGAPATKKPINKLDIPSDAIIGGIIRQNESFIATGNFQIKENDHVIVFSLPKAIKKIEKLFH